VTSLGALLDDSTIAPDAPIVSAPAQEWTRQELERRVAGLAGLLAELGVRPGHAVGVMLPDGAEVVAALFGVWRAGAAHVPINPRLSPTELARLLETLQPAAVVTDDEHAPRVQGGPVAVSTPDGWRGIDGPIGDPALHEPDIALIQFTSGTTGRPKAVLLRHSGVLELLDGVLGTLRGKPKGGGSAKPPMPNLVPVSLSLWAGIYQVLFAMRVGAPIVILGRFETRAFAEAVARYGIRSTVLPPGAMSMLSDDESIETLAPLRYVRSISAPLSPLQARRFHERFGILVMNSYGQTEIGGEIVGWSAADLKEWGEAKLGAVGRPHRGVRVRAVDEQGEPVPAGESGELWVQTPALSAGYADGSDLGDRLTADGWFRTGDVGRVDEDGFVWIEGRVSDMINRGGLKVYPDEVAEVLRAAPGVTEAAVFGAEDDRLGEVPWAMVEVAAGAAVTAERLELHCREHLAPYKVPARIAVVREIPRNEVGKILSGRLLYEAVAGSRP
jgi:acyl-CoA synthetase (AMP-forming)/AMP-acid ligase II